MARYEQRSFSEGKLRARFQFPNGHIQELTRHCRNELLKKLGKKKYRRRIKKPDFLFHQRDSFAKAVQFVTSSRVKMGRHIFIFTITIWKPGLSQMNEIVPWFHSFFFSEFRFDTSRCHKLYLVFEVRNMIHLFDCDSAEKSVCATMHASHVAVVHLVTKPAY